MIVKLDVSHNGLPRSRGVWTVFKAKFHVLGNLRRSAKSLMALSYILVIQGFIVLS